ncbi:hypothetical protein CA13_00960 [Planctomycetes bacterium CA13]|uniref:Uncharacterized protein n=1 Tax=Novipirellula herctigrandis TaxID=2527986 RepID=A0A5C5YV42_9BACT|nr:hypothetical protein CA13_00960 [Planctomycetes bacterium CA13]
MFHKWQVVSPCPVTAAVRRYWFQTNAMHGKRKLILLGTGFAIVSAFASFSLFSFGQKPKHTNAYLTWWPAGSRVGGVIELQPSKSSVDGIEITRDQVVFESPSDRLQFSYKFLRNQDSTDVYLFRLVLNDNAEIQRSVAFDGNEAIVFRDAETGIALSIDGSDRFPY